MKSKIVVLLSILVFAVGLSIYVSTTRSSANTLTVKPFVVTYSYHKEGTDASKGRIIIEKVNALGKSKTTQYQQVSGETQLIPETGVDSELSIIQYSPEMWSQFSSAQLLQSNSAFVGQGEICGFKTYIHRYNGTEPRTVESWYAPETGAVPLKTVIETGDGRRLVTEATKVEFREVIDGELK